MTKQEFENMACATVTAEEYKIIEKVYTWHPAIRNTDGKNQIATIFLAGGMAVIQDMVETAEMAMEIDNERRKLEAKMNALKERTDRLSSGDKTFEKCRKAVERVFDSSETPEHLEKGVMKLRDSYAIEDLQEARRQLGY